MQSRGKDILILKTLHYTIENTIYNKMFQQFQENIK